LSTVSSDVDARSTGAANGRHVAIPRSRPSPSRKPTRGNGGTESGRKRGRMRSGTVPTAQFGSSVVIVSQDFPRMSQRVARMRAPRRAQLRSRGDDKLSVIQDHSNSAPDIASLIRATGCVLATFFRK
jgi:hypothetical protein